MIDIEILTVVLKELGYLDDSDKDEEKEDLARDKSEPKQDRKENDKTE